MTSISERQFGEAIGRIPGQIGALSVLVGLPLLFFPKINLISVPGMAAGVRVDDFLLATILALLLISFVYQRKAYLDQTEVVLAVFLGAGLLSFVTEGGTALFVFRILEYFTFFYIGVNASQYIRLRPVLICFLIFNFLLIALQAAGEIGSFENGVYTPIGPAIGIGSGNWDIGQLLNIAWVALAFGRNCKPHMVFVLGMLLICAHFFIGSRTPAVTFGIVFVAYFFWTYRKHSAILILSVPFVCFALFLGSEIITTSFARTNLMSRMSSLSTTDLESVMTKLWWMIPAKSDFSQQSHLRDMIDYTNQDASLLERAEKIVGAIKFFKQSGPLAWVVGTGPGRYGMAMDLGMVRLLVENGVVGFVSLFTFINCCLRYSSARWPLLLIFSASMMTLDTYIGYKMMSLLLLIGGMTTGDFIAGQRSSARMLAGLSRT